MSKNRKEKKARKKPKTPGVKRKGRVTPLAFNPAKALNVQPLPDLDIVKSLRDLAAEPQVKFSETATELLPSKTKEQRELEACNAAYKRVAAADPAFLQAVSTMIALRRGYAVAYRELMTIIEAAAKEQNVPDTLADFSAQYAMYAASKPFNEHVVMQGFLEVVMPWLADVIDKHTKADKDEELAAKAAYNAARKDRPIPIELKHTPTQVGDSLERSRSLVLVGWQNAVLWLLDRIVGKVLVANDAQVYTTVRLGHKRKENHSRLVNLAGKSWLYCADSDRAIDEMVGKHLAKLLGSPVDLVVCDDLSYASASGFVGRHPAARAGDAHRRFRKWCDRMGAAFIGAVPFQMPILPDLSGSEFEQLKTFSNMRPVQVLDGEAFGKENHYRIIVGDSATVFDVLKSVIDAYTPSLFSADYLEGKEHYG